MFESAEMYNPGKWYNESPMRAIDLYSGVGGWTLGLRMAGVKVVRSFEWWKEANITHNKNFGTDHDVVDIRSLKLRDLDRLGKIDIVVGSPPCTQFSYSNRGGGGDIQDGLVDIRKFLEIVAYVRPRFWAMENVPRVAGILEQELAPGGQLDKFKKLVKVIEVVDSADFGVPQNRRRMIAGNFPAELFFGYKTNIQRRTLGDVVSSLAADPAVDPVYGFQLSRAKLTDHQHEAPLSLEERRLNDESKRYHPVYNSMQFPDRFDRPSRTVTATCTRVSRESIVIKDPKTKALRRLTVRERAAVQSFPITYQYYGRSYQIRQKLVGNAVPPLLTYFIASSMRKIPSAWAVKIPKAVSRIHPLPRTIPSEVRVEGQGRVYPPTRRFRAALPGLRFGSGVRFELANHHKDGETIWQLGFYFGPSKSVRSIGMGEPLENSLLGRFEKSARGRVQLSLDSLSALVPSRFGEEAQSVWTHQKKGVGPYELVDGTAAGVSSIECLLSPLEQVCREALAAVIVESGIANVPAKLLKNSVKIVAGLLMGSRLNALMAAERHDFPHRPRSTRQETPAELVAA